MKINIFRDLGSESEKTAEDGILEAPEKEIYAVTDGASGIYRDTPQLFDGITGGQLASNTIVHFIEKASTHDSLRDIVLSTNDELARVNQLYGLKLDQAEYLPSAAISAVKINDSTVEGLTVGDCYIAWKMLDGTVGISFNPMSKVDAERVEEFSRLMKKSNGNIKKAWKLYLPFYKESKKKWTNTEDGIAILNGQKQDVTKWQEFSFRINELDCVILFTDGLVRLEDTKDHNLFLAHFFKMYDTGGVEAVMQDTRTVSTEAEDVSHVKSPEATALVINF